MQPRTTSHSLCHLAKRVGPQVTTLERRIAELAQLADSQSRELRIQFERIAQMQAEWDVLRIRLIKP
jgi:hypothetical protein